MSAAFEVRYSDSELDDLLLHELQIPFRGTGTVALHEITDAAHVTVLAIRHQLEDDYH